MMEITFDQSNPNHLVETSKLIKDFLNGVVVLDVPAKKVVQKNDLYYKVALDGEDTILKMIPYYAWANRDEADMSVWFPKA